jgi:hypothetical protein
MHLDFNEYFSNFKSVKHNDWFTLFLFYGVMKYVQGHTIDSGGLLLTKTAVFGLSFQHT